MCTERGPGRCSSAFPTENCTFALRSALFKPSARTATDGHTITRMCHLSHGLCQTVCVFVPILSPHTLSASRARELLYTQVHIKYTIACKIVVNAHVEIEKGHLVV